MESRPLVENLWNCPYINDISEHFPSVQYSQMGQFLELKLPVTRHSNSTGKNSVMELFCYCISLNTPTEMKLHIKITQGVSLCSVYICVCGS